jgi:hypothetical protein
MISLPLVTLAHRGRSYPTWLANKSLRHNPPPRWALIRLRIFNQRVHISTDCERAKGLKVYWPFLAVHTPQLFSAVHPLDVALPFPIEFGHTISNT